MIYIILSDIHSNLQAFKAVLESFPKKNDIRIMCAGDIVGYGADPVICMKIMQERDIKSVLGNHDAAVVNKMEVSNLNKYAAEAVHWTREHIKQPEYDYLNSLPFILHEESFTIVHGTLHFPQQFIYMTSGAEAMHTFEVLKTKICFVGHSHIPGVFMEKGGRIYQLLRKKVTLEQNARYIVNVGSVGQPRDYNNRACYCIFYPKKNMIEFFRIKYDIKSARKAIINAGLPKVLGERLLSGE